MAPTDENLNQLSRAALTQLQDMDGEALEKLNFDTQGRVMIEVKLEGDAKATLVSVDISQNERLQSAFIRKMLVGSHDVETDKAMLEKFFAMSRGSVIPLHQEISFHMKGAMRVLTDKTDGVLKELFQPYNDEQKTSLNQALQSAESQLNQKIQFYFLNALKRATIGQTTDIAKLNTFLDEARGYFAKMSQAILIENIAKHTGQAITPNEMIKQIPESVKQKNSVLRFFGLWSDKDSLAYQLKHLAETKTATSQDILVMEPQLGTITWIEGTNATAHERKQTEENNIGVSAPASFGHRQIITRALATDGSVIPEALARFQIRTPSPVVKEGISDSEAAHDVKNKFFEVLINYDLSNKLSKSDVPGIPRTFVYNHHTAINYSAILDGKNKQTQSAKHILSGMHEFNAIQHARDDGNGVYAFVQNISVNGFGDSLGYEGNALAKETTLMAEMAMMHTMHDILPEEQKSNFVRAIAAYNVFLANFNPNKSSNFYDSAQGKLAKSEIQKIKDAIKVKRGTLETGGSAQELVKHALLNIVANDRHFSHDYAKTIQALSIFVEQASISGCKSGNERAEAITKRVGIIDSLAAQIDAPSKDMENFKTALVTAAGTQTAEATKVLHASLNDVTNRLGLQSATVAISQTDQLSGAKLKPRPSYLPVWGKGIIEGFINMFKNIGIFFQRQNTNAAEEEAMTNLKQSGASENQAHKGFAKNIIIGAEFVEPDIESMLAIHAAYVDHEAIHPHQLDGPGIRPAVRPPDENTARSLSKDIRSISEAFIEGASSNSTTNPGSARVEEETAPRPSSGSSTGP